MNLEGKIDRARFVKRHKPLNRKTKLKIVFDEDDRREFLTGFHKRKVERKKKAHEELLQKLKEERRRIKHEGKNIYKNLVTSYKPLPEFENCHSENLDFENHSVSVTEISPDDVAWKNNWIGANRVEYEEETNNKAKSCDDDTDVKHNEEEEGGDKIKDTSNVLGKDIKSTKDIKKALQKKATAQFKNSKPFQIKNRIEHQRQKKRSLMLKRIRAEKRKNKHKKSKN